MTNIKISDGNENNYDIGLKPVVFCENIVIIVNPREFGIEIANKIFYKDSEDDIIIDEIFDIIDFKMEEIRDKIVSEAIDVLEDNGINIHY